MPDLDTVVQLLRAHTDTIRARLHAQDPRNSRIETIEVVILVGAIVILALALVALLTGFFDRHKGPLEG